MNTGAVLEPGVYNRTLGVNGAVNAGNDLLNQVRQLFGTLKGFVPSFHLPFSFHKDFIRTVYHDFRNARII